MTTASTAKKSSRLFLWSWLLVATLDLSAASIQTLIAGGSLTRLCQFIASGFFGQEAFSSPVYVIYGIVFHYLIALSWTTLFFFLYRNFNLSRFNKYLVAVLYGIVIWFVMNRIVLPMSNITPRPFDLTRSLIAASILIVAIGLPLSLILSRNSEKR